MKIRIPDFSTDPPVDVPVGDLERLGVFLRTHPRVMVITGAGCSTASGIPGYRDATGRWLRGPPMSWQEFSGQPAMRRRYWARSHAGWPRMQAAVPNGAHRALAELERQGRLGGLLTQNVDGLHGRAGSRNLIELHGSLSRVVCMDCAHALSRAALQEQLCALNPDLTGIVAGIRPDGDAVLDDEVQARFRVPECPRCAGVLRPGVVFFGERVPASRVESAWRMLDACTAVLAVGTSLAVQSAYRFALEAARRGMPVVAVNEGRTRADAMLEFRVQAPCEDVLAALSGLYGAHVCGTRQSA